jgi:hypothetical protein
MGRGSQQGQLFSCFFLATLTSFLLFVLLVVGAVNPSCVSQTFDDEALRKVVDTINVS